MSTPPLAAAIAQVPLAATMQAAARARDLRAQGHDVISLSLGEPDFATPAHIVAAAHAAALRGETKYPPVAGTAALIEAVRRKFRRENGLDFAASQILVGHGARQIIADALVAMLEPGTELIVPAPYWNAYPMIAALQGAETVYVPCAMADGFLPRPEAIAAAITERTRALVLNFPNNPTGAVCPAAHLQAIAAILRRHPHVWVLSDEIYENLIHDGTANPGLAAVAPDLADRVLTISGCSKTYAMTGWRIGFAGGPAPLVQAMVRVQGQLTGGVSPVAQAAAVAALDGPQEIVAEMRSAYAARSARVVAALNALPGVACAQPRAAFYAFPDISGVLGRVSEGGAVLTSDADVAASLLNEAHVAVVHGAAFGMAGFVRLSTAASDAALDEALRRIRVWVASVHLPTSTHPNR